jgi:hypothetical protein
MIALQKPPTVSPVILRHTRVLRAETSAAWKAVSCDVAKRVECGGSPPLSKACAANWHIAGTSMQACARPQQAIARFKIRPEIKGIQPKSNRYRPKKICHWSPWCGVRSGPSYILHSRPSFCTLRQPLPAFANHCQPPPHPFFFHHLAVPHGGRDAVTSHGQSRSVAPGRGLSGKKDCLFFYEAISKLRPAPTMLLRIGESLVLLWYLDVAPKAFGVEAFVMVAAHKDFPTVMGTPIPTKCPIFTLFCTNTELFK